MEWENEFIIYTEKNLSPSEVPSVDIFKVDIIKKNFNPESRLPLEKLESESLDNLVERFVEGGYRINENDLLRTVNSLSFITSQNVSHFNTGEFDYNKGKDKKLYSPIEKDELERFYKLYVMMVNSIEENEGD